MFRCAASGSVSGLYAAAGFRDVAEWDIGVDLVTQSPEEYWDKISEHVSLAVAARQKVDAPARERIRARAMEDVSAFATDGKVRVRASRVASPERSRSQSAGADAPGRSGGCPEVRSATCQPESLTSAATVFMFRAVPFAAAGILSFESAMPSP